jgi:hypothetical protein
MSDDLNRLRQSMSQLAEHGGNTDLHERALQTSRRMDRRRAIASGVAVAVLTIGVSLALIQRQQSHPTPADTATAPATAPATGTATPGPSTGPTPTSRPTSSSPSAPGRSTSGDGCPVSASALDKVADYPVGWKIDAASIRCSRGWAVAGVIAPTPDQQGNGVIVFRYDTGTGKWKKKGEGSDIECAAFDMPPSTGLCSTG